ncbi:MAG: transposase [Gammaproteobacteria bacterium]
MPRRRRQCPPGLPVHVVQRGNNRQIFFASDADMKAYANWLHEGANKFGVDVHAWVFMTNHVHLLLTPHSSDSISRCMQYLGRYYVRYFNHRHDRSGTLFEGRFKSNIVQTGQYLLGCQRYIELNPVRAGMVSDPADYTWSSYRAHAFGRAAKMWQPHPEYLALGRARESRMSAYRQLLAQQLATELITDICDALNTGLVLGNDRFRQEVEKLTGQRQRHRKRGPRPAKSDDSK